MTLFLGVALSIVFVIVWAVLSDVVAFVRARVRTSRSFDTQMLEVHFSKVSNSDAPSDPYQDAAVAEQLLMMLSSFRTPLWERFLYGKPAIVLELLARPSHAMTFAIGTERKYLQYFKSHIIAQYPDAHVRVAPKHSILESGYIFRAFALRLKKGAHLPIATHKELGDDPMRALTGALASIRRTDTARIQYVLTPAPQQDILRASRAIRRMIPAQYVGGISQLSKVTNRMQRRIELIRAKMVQPQFAVNIRVGLSLRYREDVKRVSDEIASSFEKYNLPDLNQFERVVPKNTHAFDEKLISRRPDEDYASILGIHEIASLYHLPSS